MNQNFKQFFNDSSRLRDAKTGVTAVFALLLAIFSNGLINGFSWQSIFSINVGLGGIGTYFALRIIISEFAERAEFDEIDENKELRERLEKQRDLSKQIKSSIAYDILLQDNKNELEGLRKEKLEEKRGRLLEKIKKNELLIENLKLQPVRWFRFIKRSAIPRLERRLARIRKKEAELSLYDVYVKFEGLTLQSLRVVESQRDEEKMTQAARFRQTPKSRTKRQSTLSTLIKAFGFISFNGALVATIESWWEFGWFVTLMVFTLTYTALRSYVTTRRYAQTGYIGILDEKNDKIAWLLKEQAKIDKPSQE